MEISEKRLLPKSHSDGDFDCMGVKEWYIGWNTERWPFSLNHLQSKTWKKSGVFPQTPEADALKRYLSVPMDKRFIQRPITTQSYKKEVSNDYEEKTERIGGHFVPVHVVRVFRAALSVPERIQHVLGFSTLSTLSTLRKCCLICFRQPRCRFCGDRRTIYLTLDR